MRRTLISLVTATLLVGSTRAAEPTSRPASSAPTYDAADALATRVREVAADTQFLNVTDALCAREGRDGPQAATEFDRLMSRLPPVTPLRLDRSRQVAARWIAVTTAPATTRAYDEDEAELMAILASSSPASPPPPPPDVADAAFPIAPELIAPLLGDADPKVRAWAIILLARLNRIDVLPAIAAMADDAARTFPSYVRLSPLAGSLPSDEYNSAIERRRGMRHDGPARTVGDVAALTVEFFLNRSPTLAQANPPPPSDAAGLVAFVRRVVAERDDRASVMAFRLAFERVIGGQSGARADRVAAQRALLYTVFDLPAPRRFFVLRALGADPSAWTIASEVEGALARFAAEVPREQRSATLFSGKSFVDPDLPAGFGDGYFLAHAERFFVPGDADAFLSADRDARAQSASESNPNGTSDAALSIAAARLRPDRATPILADALARSNGRFDADRRAAFAAELVVLVGPPAFDRALATLFSERPEPGSHGGGRERFLGDVFARRPECFAALAARIVRDGRLDRLGPQTLLVLVDFAESRLGRPIVSADERAAARGIDEAQRDGPFASLSGWRSVLRSTVDEWAGPASTTRP